MLAAQDACLQNRHLQFQDGLPYRALVKCPLSSGSTLFYTSIRCSSLLPRWSFDMHMALTTTVEPVMRPSISVSTVLAYVHRTRLTGIFQGLSFYLSSKLMIYWYFTERSYLVWSDRSQTRRQNKLYIFNMTVINGI